MPPKPTLLNSKIKRFAISITFFVTISYSTIVNYTGIRTLSRSLPNSNIDPPSPHGNQSCFRANPSLPSPNDSFPIINLGFPKIGSTSLHSFFSCAGHRSTHYRCSPTHTCAHCIARSIALHLPPLHECVRAEVYTQIDDGSHGHFPQIQYLDELVRGHPRATFLLTFRDMDGWYASLRGWSHNSTGMDRHLLSADIPGFPAGVGRNVEEFRGWFCRHVMRVREIASRTPTMRLVEIDIEEGGGTVAGEVLSTVLDVDVNCWGRSNVNREIHPELDGSGELEEGGQLKWFVPGRKMIRGRNGTRRRRDAGGSVPLFF